MSNTTQDLYGAVLSPEPATPDSYGERPSGYRLPEATRLGKVRLQVADLARSLAFYEGTLGLQVVEQSATFAALAAVGQARVLVELEERRGVRPAGRGLLGLYHFAILLPDRPSLGRFVQHLASTGVPFGAGDHLVSEAFYLTDPDGLGIEVYADRPRSTWRRIGRELMIATDPVDVDGVIASAAGTPWAGMPAGAVIGHVHLHVGDLARAAALFSEALGFDRMSLRYAGVLFVGAGGYHHHLGTNTWAGAGARPPAKDDARLLAWTIEVPSAADVDDVVRSLTAAGYAVDRRTEFEAEVSDPWGTHVIVHSVG
jgi:catechol 2,3-dioxygenase